MTGILFFIYLIIAIIFIVLAFTENEAAFILTSLFFIIFAVIFAVIGISGIESEAYKRGQEDCLNGNIKYQIERVDTVKIYKPIK